MVQAVNEFGEIHQETALRYSGIDGLPEPWAERDGEGGGRVRGEDGETH